MRPIIGITSAHRNVPSSAGEERAHVLYNTYSIMVREAGGIPVVLVPTTEESVPTILGRIDGLVLSGGGDIDPTLYGGEHNDAVYDIDPERDAFELALAKTAAEQRLPTLAICRGMQVVNVAFGGTLIPDIGTGVPGAEEHRRGGDEVYRPLQEISIEPGSTTASTLGCNTLLVNTVHHQAIADVGDGLNITGRAPDGVVETVEAADATWPMWAVQWHPEWLGPDDGPSLRLFAELIAAASA
jgi:putative glutamine amidotransferase